MLPAALPQECPLGPFIFEDDEFLSLVSIDYDEIGVVVLGEGTFTYDLSSVGGDCPAITYTYNISYDANCTNNPVINEFNFEVCIGDTITAPAIFPSTCPLGPYPPQANPNGDDYIVQMISVGPNELSFIALGAGSFTYQLPQIISPVDNLPCPTDIHKYNITIKDDCVYEPIVYNVEVCEGEIVSIPVPYPSGSCAIGHTETPDDPNNPIIEFLGHTAGGDFDFIALASGSITIDELPTDPFGNDCDGLLKPVIVNITVLEECDIEVNNYDFTACYGDTLVLPVGLPQGCIPNPIPIEAFYFLQPINSTNDEINVVVVGEGSFTYDFSSLGGNCSRIINHYNISFDPSCDNTPTINEFNFEVCIGDTINAPAIFQGTCPLGPYPQQANPNGDDYIIEMISIGSDELSFIALGAGSFTYQLPQITSPVDGIPCSSDIHVYNITIKNDCVYPSIDNICFGDAILIEGPSILPAGPQGPPGSPTQCTNVTSVSISPMDEVISQTDYGFYVAPQESITYTLESTATSGGGPGSGGCTPISISQEFVIEVYECYVQPPLGAAGPDGAETDFPSIYSIVDTNNCCDNQTVAIYIASNGAKFLYVEPNTDCSTNSPTLYDNNGLLLCTGNSTTDCLASYNATFHNYTWTCTTDDECDCNSDLDTVYDVEGNEYANPCIAECAGVKYYDEVYFTCPGESVELVGEVISKFCPFCDSPGSLAESFPNWTGVDCSGCISVTVAPTETTTYTAFTEGIACFDPCGPTGPTGPSASRSFAVVVNEASCQTEPDIIICLGDQVLIEGPQTLPPGPQGPNGTTSCTLVNQVSISPTDGVVSDSDFGFYVSPTSTTTYTITSSAGPTGPGGGCISQTVTRTFEVGVTQNCDPTDLVCPGDTVILTLPPNGPHNPDSGPNGPPPGQVPTSCDILTVTPNDENVITLPNNEGFMVIANTTTLYTVTRKAIVTSFCYAQTFEIYQDTYVEVADDCPTEPEPCVITDPFQLPFIQEIISYSCADDCGRLDQITAFEYNEDTYFGLFNNIVATNCPIETGGITYVDCNGDFFCSTSTLPGTENFCSNEFINIASNATIIWSNDNICNDEIDPEAPDTGYDWLDELLDPNDCCANESAVEFPMGSYSFIYVKTAADCGGLGELYINTGQLYCSDADNFDCLGAYGLNESSGNTIWSCGDGPTEPVEPVEPVDFDDYPWLNNIIDQNDCCANESIIVFPMGSYSFVYVNAGANCGGLGVLYLNTGKLYCTDTANFDCLGAYGLNESDGNVIWTCGTDDKPADDSDETTNDDLTEQSSRLDNNGNTSIEMKVYPNPSNGLVNISLNTKYEGDQTIRVLDLSGRTINEIRFTDAKSQIFQTDLTDLPDGLYLIEYSNANISNVEKVMVRH